MGIFFLKVICGGDAVKINCNKRSKFKFYNHNYNNINCNTIMNNNNKFNNIGCSYSPLTNGIAKGMETRITSTPLSSVSVRQQKYNVSPSKISGFFTPTR